MHLSLFFSNAYLTSRVVQKYNNPNQRQLQPYSKSLFRDGFLRHLQRALRPARQCVNASLLWPPQLSW